MSLNMIDAMLAIRTRLYIHAFLIESQKFRIDRDLNLWSGPIPHLIYEIYVIYPIR